MIHSEKMHLKLNFHFFFHLLYLKFINNGVYVGVRAPLTKTQLNLEKLMRKVTVYVDLCACMYKVENFTKDPS